MFKKIYCFIFGHKKHEIEWLKNIPILEFFNKEYNVKYSINICDRCNCVYNTSIFYNEK